MQKTQQPFQSSFLLGQNPRIRLMQAHQAAKYAKPFPFALPLPFALCYHCSVLLHAGDTMPRISAISFHTAVLPPLNLCWKEVLDLADKLEFSQGTQLTLNTERENFFYFLEQGRLSLVHDTENGKTRPISTMEEAGTLLNVTHALARQMTDFIEKGCHFHCITDVTLRRFNGSLLQDEGFIRTYPHLIVNLMASLGVKILAHHTILAHFGTGGALAQLCRFCFNLSDANDGAAKIAPGISQTQLARLLGMDRATLVRLLQKLRRIGVILELNRDRLVIGDMKKLRQLAVQ